MGNKGSNWRFLPYLIIAFSAIIIYINALDNAFHYDDEHDIVANSFLEKWENIPLLFTSARFYQDVNISAGHYRPLVYVTYALNKITGGNNPFGYHVVNLAFHVGSAMLLFLIIRTMLGDGGGERSKKLEVRSKTKSNILPLTSDFSPSTSLSPPLTSNFFIAFIAALIFAVHPFNSEAVNYITARSSVMSGFFYLLAFYCWVKYREGGGRGEKLEVRGEKLEVRGKKLEVRSKKVEDGIEKFGKGYSNFYLLTSYFYLGSLLAFLLAMLSKESAITLPVVLWLYDLYFTPRLETRSEMQWGKNLTSNFLLLTSRLPAYLPFILAVALPAIAVRFLFWDGVVPSFKRSLVVQLYTELPVLVKHLWFFIFPVGLNIEHQIEIYKTFFAWPVAGSALILALYVVIAFLAARSKGIEWKVLSFFMLWFFIVLLPIIIIPLNAVFQENRGYLAIIVFAVSAGVVLSKLTTLPRVEARKSQLYAIVLMIIIVTIYGAGTVYRNGVWQDGMSLWSDAAAKSQASSRAHTNLGTEYARRGMNEAAIGSFIKALRFSESDGGAEPANIHYNLGTVYQQMGRHDMSAKEYMSVIGLNPSDFRPWYNLGVIYQQRGETDAAMKAYEMVITRNPSHFKSYHNIGLIYHNRGDTSLAAEYYRKALSINTGYTRSRVNLEAIYKKQEGR